jgi:hypothetical protein
MVDDSCDRAGDEPALTINYESVPFMRQQTGAQTTATDTTMPWATAERLLPRCSLLTHTDGCGHDGIASNARRQAQQARPPLPSSPGKGAGERSQVIHEQIGLFHRGEVPTAVELSPVYDVREASFG